MNSEKQFVGDGIKKAYIEEFLAKEFSKAGYSHSDIQRTPLATRIVIFVQKPGLVIGKGGKNIDMITEALKEKFKLENPQLDVREVEKIELDAAIIARQIASAIERGLNHKKVANIMLQRVMEAGAVGIAIRIAGKLSGEKSRTEKFSAGYLKYAGETAETLVNTAKTTAFTKPGIIGISIKIMTELPKEATILKRLEQQRPQRSEVNDKKTEAA